MDELLGLELGEGGVRMDGPGCCGGNMENWLREKKGLSLVSMERASIPAYATNDHALSVWGARIQEDRVSEKGDAHKPSVTLYSPLYLAVHFTPPLLFFEDVQCSVFHSTGSMGGRPRHSHTEC